MAQEDYSAIAASAPVNPVPANLAESHPQKILEYVFWKVKDIPFLEHSLALLPPAGQLPPDQVLLVTNLLEFWFLSVFHRLHLPFWRQFLVWFLVTNVLEFWLS